jgi:hypothetical protein
MSIIRFSTDEVFNTDSSEYEILANACLRVKDIPGAILELGTRRGGSAKLIMDTLHQNGDSNRSFFCIDPYGNIEIPCTNLNMSVHYPGTKVEGDPASKDIISNQRFDYTNDMRNRIIPSLYYYGYQKGFNFTFFCLEDTEFFKRYEDGVPVYDQYKTLINEYALVFLDGPHDNNSLIQETEFFCSRMPVGSMMIHDDIWMFSLEEIVEPIMFSRGFEVVEKGKIKASYMRTK